MSTKKHLITSFYKFVRLDLLEKLQNEIENKAQELEIQGLWILGSEGFNSTCSSTDLEKLEQWKTWVTQKFNTPDLFFKDSESDKAPFRRFKVKIRKEIVTIGAPGLFPTEDKTDHHLTPEEWNRVLKEENDFVMIDTRNWYETKIGTFKGALDPKIDQFTEFPEYVEKTVSDKNKKMLIFCTGGIRCEKGILELQKRGYKNVYQLYGGILNYLQKYPNDQFEGECFVFDHRVAVDQNLKPSQVYKLCPHCGQPAEAQITCSRCDTPAHVCDSCLEKNYVKETCSKNCAHWWEVFPGKKGRHQELSYEAKESHQN